MPESVTERLSGTGIEAGPFAFGSCGVRLLFDTTGRTVSGDRECRQSILEAVCAQLDHAKSLAIVDCFLWNDWQGSRPVGADSPSNILVDALLALRKRHPDAMVLVLTDPINRAYGRTPSAPLARLIAGGVPLVWTDLDRLPDSNRLYSLPARLCARLLRQVPPARRFFAVPARHPFEPSGPSVRRADLMRMLHFKANHRKVVVTDSPEGGLQALVASWNPHDGSAAHTNVALQFDGAATGAVAMGELDCMEWSARQSGCVSGLTPVEAEKQIRQARAYVASCAPRDAVEMPIAAPRLTWLTEQAIRSRLIKRLQLAGSGDILRVALFYLSDRGVMHALIDAVRRGAHVKMILDPNRDAFGRTKNGIPNRVAASALMRRVGHGRPTGSLAIRWADTHGEQFHVKALSIASAGGGCLLLGSANWTRRNLSGFNLEADVLLEQDESTRQEFDTWFDARWDNGDGLACTLPFEAFAERGARLLLKTLVGLLQETTGLGTF